MFEELITVVTRGQARCPDSGDHHPQARSQATLGWRAAVALYLQALPAQQQTASQTIMTGLTHAGHREAERYYSTMGEAVGRGSQR